MKPLLPLAALVALCGSSAAFAANFTIPMAFEYIALDGKEIETSMFNHTADIELDEGTHKIAIRYHDMVEDDFSDSETFVKSAAFIVTLSVDGDHNYLLKPADGDFVKHPKTFAKSPQVIISRSDKGQVNYKVTQTNISEESFVSRLFSGNQQKDVDAAAAVATGVAVSSSTPSAPVSKPAPVAMDPAVAATSPVPPVAKGSADDAAHAQQMLQYWWLHADEETRKEFMSWAIKQL